MITAILMATALLAGPNESAAAVANAQQAKASTDNYRAVVAGYLAGEQVNRSATQARFDGWKIGKPMFLVQGVASKLASAKAQLDLGYIRLAEGDEERLTANTILILAESYLADGQWVTAEGAASDASLHFGTTWGKYNAAESAACNASGFLSEANSIMDAW